MVFAREFLVMKIKYFASGFFLCTHHFSRGIQKCYLEHRAGIRKTRKMKGKKVLIKIKDMMTHLRSGNDILDPIKYSPLFLQNPIQGSIARNTPDPSPSAIPWGSQARGRAPAGGNSWGTAAFRCIMPLDVASSGGTTGLTRS